jgi:ribonucleotide reductase alpha subunit
MQTNQQDTQSKRAALRLWNLETLAAIYRERGDEQAASETEQEAYELLKMLAAGVQ